MARTLKETEENLKASFMGNETIREVYGLEQGKAFDEQFSKVSIENLLIYTFSSGVWLLEKLWDSFSVEVDQKIENSQVTSVSWYHQKALEFQKGDDLSFDEKTYSYKYKIPDESKRIVRNVAIRQVTDEGVTKLKVYFSDSGKQPLSDALQQSFMAYMREIGAAGTHYLFVSKAPDALRVQLQIYYNPLILDSAGTHLENGSKPVEDAIQSYLNNLEYGGVYYSSALVDVIQATQGVRDVVLKSTTWNGTTELRRKIESESGAFTYEANTEDLTYLID